VRHFAARRRFCLLFREDAVNLDFFSEHYRSRSLAGFYMAASILVAHVLEFIVPGMWLLPVVAGLTFWLLFAHSLRRGEYVWAVKSALVWALMLVVVQVALSMLWPGVMEGNILRGAAYRDEMFRWVRTGEGSEGSIALFLPIHLRHFVLFCVVSAASGGALGLVMGAAMLGYMNFYVGSLIAVSGGSLLAAGLGWQVWAIVRVIGFIVAGTALGGILVDKTVAGAAKRAKILRWMYPAVALIVADIVLKWALAGAYQAALSGVLGG
jgi:hypothetical protein